jgi:hypothetical protein
MNNDLLSIAVRFGSRIGGFNDMFIEKIKNDSQMKMKNSDDAIFVTNIKNLIFTTREDKEWKAKQYSSIL